MNQLQALLAKEWQIMRKEQRGVVHYTEHLNLFLQVDWDQKTLYKSGGCQDRILQKNMEQPFVYVAMPSFTCIAYETFTIKQR